MKTVEHGIRESGATGLLARTRTLMAATVAVALTATACGPAESQVSASREPSRPPVTHKVQHPDEPLVIVIPGVARISGEPGAVSGGTIIARAVEVDRLPSGLADAGPGVQVDLAGADLESPLTMQFETGPKPADDAIPVVAARSDNGEWNVRPAQLDSRGRIVVSTTKLSFNMPAWLNPADWLSWVGDRLASLFFGRTDPINCRGGAPDWAYLTSDSPLVHTCLTTTPDGTGRAEAQIKSNRGTLLEVTIPEGAEYAWVEGQPQPVRDVIGRALGTDSGRTVMLPAGATMTFGYSRPAASAGHVASVSPTTRSIIFGLFMQVLDEATSTWLSAVHFAPGGLTLGALYTLQQCMGGIDIGGASIGSALAAFSDALPCVLGDATKNLADPNVALAAARNMLGSAVDNATLQEQAALLTSLGGAVSRLGLILQVLPLLQQAISNLSDTISQTLAEGGNQVALNLVGPASAPGPSPAPGPAPGPAPSPSPSPSPGPASSLSFEVTGSCTSAGGALSNRSSGFTPGGRYTISAWYPNGAPYTALDAGASGTVRADGSVVWNWPCAGDPSGTYATELTDSASGRTTGRVPFTIGDSAATPPASTPPTAPPAPAPTPPPSPATTYTEQQGSHGVNTFTNYHNASGMGPRIEAWQYVEVSCKVYDPTIASVNPDGYWYRIASSPWNGAYYAAANTFMNGDVVGQPYVHNTDYAVPDC